MAKKKDQDVSIAESMAKLRAKGWDGQVLGLMAPSTRKYVQEAERRGVEKKGGR